MIYMDCIVVINYLQKRLRSVKTSYSYNIADGYGIKICGVNRLVPNLGNKSKCVVHQRNLQLED